MYPPSKFLNAILLVSQVRPAQGRTLFELGTVNRARRSDSLFVLLSLFRRDVRFLIRTPDSCSWKVESRRAIALTRVSLSDTVLSSPRYHVHFWVATFPASTRWTSPSWDHIQGFPFFPLPTLPLPFLSPISIYSWFPVTHEHSKRPGRSGSWLYLG